MSHLSVSPRLFFSPLVATRRCRCLLQVSGWMSCLDGCSLWSRRSWLGGSLVSALSFVASCTRWIGPCSLRVSFPCCVFRAIIIMTHKLSSCIEWDDTLLSPFELSVSPINWHLSRHCGVFGLFGCFVWFVCLCLCVFVFLFFGCFWCFVLLRFVFWWWRVTGNRIMYRSFTS